VLTVDASMTCCGKLFQSLTTLLEKNVLRTVVVYLGLNSFSDCDRIVRGYGGQA